MALQESPKAIINALVCAHDRCDNIHTHTRNIMSAVRLIQHHLSENNTEKIKGILNVIENIAKDLEVTSQRLHHTTESIHHYIESVL